MFIIAGCKSEVNKELQVTSILLLKYEIKMNWREENSAHFLEEMIGL
jgi:hypothetical protein